MCGCAQPKVPTNPMPESLLSSSGNFEPSSIVMVTDPVSNAQMVAMEYLGDEFKFTVKSIAKNNHTYLFGSEEHRRVRGVFMDDVKRFLSFNKGGKPEFRQLSNIAVPEVHDPAAFLGHPITA